MTAPTVLAIGSDPNGFPLKTQLIGHLKNRGFAIEDFGAFTDDSSEIHTLPHQVADFVASGHAAAGIFVDSLGLGSAMSANQVTGVFAAACHSEEMATKSREEYGANFLCIGSDCTMAEQALRIVEAFLRSPPSSKAPPPPKPRLANFEHLSSPENTALTRNDNQNVNPGGLSLDQSESGKIRSAEIARRIDHTLLKPGATDEDVRNLCVEAKTYSFWSVCVNPIQIRNAREYLEGSPVRVCSVIGFPLGASLPRIKAEETRMAIQDGANEIDMVLQIGALKSRNDSLVLKDIQAVTDICRDQQILSKVIFETALLTDEEIIRACKISMEAKADYVKTSTGFSSRGAAVHDILLMSRTVASNRLGVKASGGIRCYADALKMIQAGATRLGTSSGVAIVQEAAAAKNKPRIAPSQEDGY